MDVSLRTYSTPSKGKHVTLQHFKHDKLSVLSGSRFTLPFFKYCHTKLAITGVVSEAWRFLFVVITRSSITWPSMNHLRF